MNAKKKRIIIITAAVLAAAVITLSIALPLTIGRHKLDAPADPTVVAVTAESDYSVIINWEAVPDAIAYGLEYVYELYSDEVNTVNTTAASAIIPRIKGNLKFRVRAFHKKDSMDSEYSGWVSYDVPEIKLAKADALTITRQRDYENPTVSYYYTATEDSRNDWSQVRYTYKGVTKKIDFYEMKVLAPSESDDELQYKTAEVYSYTELKQRRYYVSEKGVWRVYLRAANYAVFDGQIIYDENKPELFDLYGTGSEWTVIEFTAV